MTQKKLTIDAAVAECREAAPEVDYVLIQVGVWFRRDGTTRTRYHIQGSDSDRRGIISGDSDTLCGAVVSFIECARKSALANARCCMNALAAVPAERR